MTAASKPYESEAEKEAATKPAPLPVDAEAEDKSIEEEGEPLGGNVA